ncbi:unnamed protein product [Enterobius vermicularis]|uniref:Uncharacterized protein n=1 Tax=Enterobius vermicularis TaxID=51028 RepID=A0A0N4VRK8_ENTVE|nr:unnamed protein product [Enterobius vermicularis]
MNRVAAGVQRRAHLAIVFLYETIVFTRQAIVNLNFDEEFWFPPENKGEKSPSIFSRNMNERPTGGFEGLEEEERQRTKQLMIVREPASTSSIFHRSAQIHPGAAQGDYFTIYTCDFND